MLISSKHHFIFIHVYKTAGTSIKIALRPFAESRWERMYKAIFKAVGLRYKKLPRHISASKLIEQMGKEAFDSYFSFAFVRNPWDWQVSLYTFMLRMPLHRQHELMKQLGSFDAYIKWRCTEEVRFQKNFICSETGEPLVDYVGRFERLEEDFATICNRIGIKTSLPKLNVSNKKPFQEFYTEETRELVRRTFEPDIRLFHYDFE